MKQILSIIIPLILVYPFKNVFAQPPCTVSISAFNNPICYGDSTQIVASALGAANFIWSPAIGLSATTGFSVKASPSSNITYTAIVSGGCSGSDSIPIIVNSNPIAVISPSGNINLCSGSSTTLSASGGNSYLWSTGATTSQITVSTGGNYAVTVTNSNGCTNSTSKNVSLVPNPSVLINPTGPTTFCSGGSVILTSNTGSAYLWSTGASTNSITVNNSGAYTVTVTNNDGCTAASTPINVIVNSLPIPTISPSGSITICEGANVTLTANGGITYQWSTGSNSSQITVSNAGTYSVTATNANGCSASTNKVVNISTPTAVITPSGTTTLCAGTSVTLLANSGAAYSWSTGATTNSVSINSSGTYTVTVTNNNGCTAVSSPITVTVNSLPNPSIIPSGPTVFCAGLNVVLNASGGTLYTWSNTSTSAQITVSNSGTYTVTVTNAANCTASISQMVTVNPNPTASTGNNQSICFGQSTIIGQSPVTGNSYSWVSNPSGFSSSIANPNVSPTITTSYTLTETINATGCTNQNTIVVTVKPLPQTPVVNNNTPICVGQTLLLNAASTAGSSYAWSGPNSYSSNIQNPIINNVSQNQSGLYTVIATLNGCQSSSNSTLVTVNGLPNVNPGTNSSICYGESIPIGTVDDVSFSYSWSSNPSGFFSNNSNPIVSPTNTTTYTLTQTINATGCTASNSIIVSVNPLPIVQVNNPTICVNSSAILNATGASTYTWFPFSSLSSSSGSTVTASPTITTTYKIIGKITATGCIDSTSSTVTVVPLPIVTGTASSYTICYGLSSPLQASGAIAYSWQPNIGLNQSTGASIIASPQLETTYTVTGINATNCESYDTVVIYVNPLPDTCNIVGPTQVCKNQSNVNYNISIPTNNAYAYSWSLINGIIQNNTNVPMSVNWNNNAEDDTIVLQQTIIATGCTNIMILPIHVSNYLSPDICSIIRKPNSNILVCSDTTDGIQYQWGYTVKATQQEVYINGATLQYVLLPHNFDTTLYIYWVTTYYNYPSQSCYTKSYFNNAIISSTSVEQFDNPIKVYPIPCADVLHIDFPYRDIILNKTRLSIKSLSGSIIFQKESLDEKHQKIDIIPFPNGVYLLEIISENYQSIHKIIIQQQ